MTTTAPAADSARARLARAHPAMTAHESRKNALRWAEFAEAQHRLLLAQQNLIERLDTNRGQLAGALLVVQGAVKTALGMIARGHAASALRVLVAATADILPVTEPTAILAVPAQLPGDLFEAA